MADLTPIEKVELIDAPTRKKLAGFWITSAEELVSTARAGNNQYGSGLKALEVALGLDAARVKEIVRAAQALLPEDVAFDALVEMDVGDGLLVDDLPEIDASSFGPPADLPPAVEPLAALPKPQFQGRRNSCVAFSLAAIYQVLSKEEGDLSEQFIYWACKDRDKVAGDVGTSPAVGMQVLQELGVPSEATWPYRVEPKDDANPGHARPPEAAFAEAKRRRISGFRQLPSKDFRQIKAALAEGKPVLIGLAIWEFWQGAWQARVLGKLRAPLPGERKGGGHAMCVVGYRDDETAPGGGYFIVRNSWGPDWAPDNPDGAGYCHVPYRLVYEQGLAAFVADGVAPFVEEVSAMSPPASAEPEPVALGAAPEAGTPTDLAALFAEAQELKTRLDRLVAGLGALLSGTPLPSAPVAPLASTASVAATASVAVPSAPKPVVSAFSGPLILIKSDTPADDELYPNGVSPEGRPLLRIDADAAANMAQGKVGAEPPELKNVYKAKQNAASGDHFGVTGDIAQEKLEEARWAIVINALEDASVLKAVWPLVEHRMRQMGFSKLDFDFRSGENATTWLSRHTDGNKKNLRDSWGTIPPVLTYRPGDRTNAWLARNGASQGPVDPRRGVPFYLMLLGRPGPLDEDDQAYIPLNFQYELDIFWGVGRLCFTSIDGRHNLAAYTTYAERVAGFESAQNAASRMRKEIVYFGTRHDMDKSTERSADELVTPLTKWSTNPANTPVKSGFSHRVFLGDDATRSNLEGVLKGTGDGKAPAVLFTATHGLGLPLSDACLVNHQGALVTADWSGAGSIKRDHWFAGEDLAGGANLEGTMAFLFACYGAGCPDRDEFIFDEQKGRPQIAPFPFIAQLPQQLLLQGALGVLGHVERAWTYSFSGTEGAKAQTQGFEDVLSRLLQGMRAGSATDQFNIVQGARASALTEELESIKFGKIVDPTELSKLWMARNDARNYALLGDPAARLAL